MRLRVSELAGLTIHDIDLENRKVTIDKQLQYRGTDKWWIDSTKTTKGTRTLPIPLKDQELYNCFKRLMNKRLLPVPNEPVVDNISGFLFLSNTNKPLVGYQ